MKSISENIISKAEKCNCITHAAGILFSIFFIPNMLSDAYESGDEKQFLNIVIYCIFFFCTFLFSTIYHWLPYSQLKDGFRKADQACIHFLIAATYLPLIFKYMNTGKGILLLALVFALVPVGVVLIWQYKSKYSPVMTSVYAFQGLMYLFFFNFFFEKMPLYTKQMILGGSIFIVAGIFFFQWKKWRYNHAIWHLFVLCGNILFFFAIQSSLQIHSTFHQSSINNVGLRTLISKQPLPIPMHNLCIFLRMKMGRSLKMQALTIPIYSVLFLYLMK